MYRSDEKAAAEGRTVLYDICNGNAGETTGPGSRWMSPDCAKTAIGSNIAFFSRDVMERPLNLDWVDGLLFLRQSELAEGELTWNFKKWDYLSLDGAYLVQIETMREGATEE